MQLPSESSATPSRGVNPGTAIAILVATALFSTLTFIAIAETVYADPMTSDDLNADVPSEPGARQPAEGAALAEADTDDEAEATDEEADPEAAEAAPAPEAEAAPAPEGRRSHRPRATPRPAPRPEGERPAPAGSEPPSRGIFDQNDDDPLGGLEEGGDLLGDLDFGPRDRPRSQG